MKMINRISLWTVLFGLLACNSQDVAVQQAKAQVIQANDELLNKGNLEYADQVFADEYGGQGPGMIKEFARNLRAAFPDLRVEVEPLIAEGNMTAWRRTHTGTHQGEYLGFPPTGKQISWEMTIISQSENGKVIEEWGTDNLLEVLLEEAGSHDSEANQVTVAAKGVIDALNRGNADSYADYLHDEFTWFLPQNTSLQSDFDPEAMKADFTAGLQFDIRLEDLSIRFYGNTAVVTGYELGTATFPDGEVADGRRKYSSVWVWEKGEWKEVHLHISMDQK